MPPMRRGVVAVVLAAGWAHAAVVLERVEVVRTPALEVRLHLSSPVVPLARTLAADGEHPARVYLDLADAALAPAIPGVVRGAADPLLRVRTGQFDPTTVRVVLDLADAVPFAVRGEGRTIVVELSPEVAVVPHEEAAPPPLEPPSTPPVPPSTPRVERPRLVVLDAGHGGHDPGATGIGGVVEKVLTLDIAHRVADRLARRGAIEVTLTRSDDTFVTIDDRIARAMDAAVFVSLHVNAAADVNLNGFEVFYGGGGIDATASGPRSPVRLGLDVGEAIGHALGSDVRTVVRPGKFGVLARNTVPSVLVEVGYLTNPDDAARLRDDGYRAVVAQAIADGAATFVEGSLDLAAR
jgi:N-acetylmuramoyl-L-alanine amidase